MAIERFGPFGDERSLPAGAPIARSDRELRAIVVDHRSADDAIPTVGLLGGDLCRTLGGTGSLERLTSSEARTFTVDIGRLVLDGAVTWFVAHVIVGRPFGGGTMIMQAEWLGDLDLGPRSHPADGRFDVTTGALPFAERRRALRRARTGSHLPHPRLDHGQRASIELAFSRPVAVEVDGVALGRHRRIATVLEPDRLQVVV